MKKRCAWCNKAMESVTAQNEDLQTVTHGICENCAKKLFSNLGTPVYDFIDKIAAPVVVTEDNVVVLGANKSARTMLGKEASQINGKLGGVVFECTYSYLPGGCGKTEHCSGCIIRNTVTNTLITGKSSKMIPVTLKQKTRDGKQQDVNIYITTEKVNNVVLLKIDTQKIETQKCA
jgi:hypothetical protein